MIDERTQYELDKKLEQLLTYDAQNLIRRGEWGSINFVEAKKDIEFVLFFAEYLSKSPCEHLSNKAATSINSHLSTIIDLLVQIDDFSLESVHRGANREKICLNLRSGVEQFFDDAIKLMSYLAFRTGDVATNVDNIKNEFQEVQATHAATIKFLEESRVEVDQIIDTIREAAASAGVVTFAEEFSDEASNLRKQSNKWLFTTGSLAVITVLTSLLFLIWDPVPIQASEWDILRSLIGKAALVVVLFTCTIWCGRIYRSLVHQAAVNRHRALSLKTFQAFTKATSDPYVKDSVLMAATKSIFASVPTGFVEQVEGQDQGVNFVKFGESAGEKIVEEVAQN